MLLARFGRLDGLGWNRFGMVDDELAHEEGCKDGRVIARGEMVANAEHPSLESRRDLRDVNAMRHRRLGVLTRGNRRRLGQPVTARGLASNTH